MSRRRTESGFTLIEVMIAVAMLGVGMAFMTSMFLNGYRLWKRSFDELLLQRQGRNCLSMITQAMREARPGFLVITTPVGMPVFSSVEFTDGRDRNWWFYQRMKNIDNAVGTTVYEVRYWTMSSTGSGATLFLADHVESLSFAYPSYQDVQVIDVGLTMRQIPYRNAARPIIVQLVERVLMRNP